MRIRKIMQNLQLRMLRMKTEVQNFVEDEEGVSTLEILLVVVVLIGLVILFKSQLTSLVTDILNKITSQSNSI